MIPNPMKYYCLVACLFIINICVHAQTTTYDSSYETTYYNQKVTLFNLLPDTKNEIIFVGNSITDIGEWAEIWQNKHVKNRGVSGDNTFGVIARLDEIVSSKPSKIFIMIGINDIAKNTPDTIVIKNYLRIIEIIKTKTPKTKLIFQSILPTNNEFTDFIRYQNKDSHIVALNKALEKICLDKGLHFVNLYPAFANELGKLNKAYTNDGLHINGYGFMLWKKILQQQGLM